MQELNQQEMEQVSGGLICLTCAITTKVIDCTRHLIYNIKQFFNFCP